MIKQGTKTIHIRYYAQLREKRGSSCEIIQTAVSTPRQLYDQLKERYSFPLSDEQIKVAVNHVFQPWDVALKDNDVVVFLPPMSGG